MKYLFLLIIFIIIFSSCQPTINEKSISVDIGKISSLPPETLFTSARIIPLETTDSSLMAQIDKVLVHKKTIYLLDALGARMCQGTFFFNGRKRRTVMKILNLAEDHKYRISVLFSGCLWLDFD